MLSSGLNTMKSWTILIPAPVEDASTTVQEEHKRDLLTDIGANAQRREDD